MNPSPSRENDHDVSLCTIRSWWKVPAISHFCSLFRTTFKLPDFEIEELEEALYQDSEADNSRFVVDLLTALLKGSFETEDIDDSNYNDYLRDICNIHWEKENRVNPLNNEDTSFQSLSTLMKVEILYTLCDYRLDANDVSILKDYDGETLRVERLGVDSKGAIYWYFYGTRLYREDIPPPRPPKAKQKKRKKKKKRCFLQALRKNLAISQNMVSEDEEESVPEPPAKKGKGKTVKASGKKGTKGKETTTTSTPGRKKKKNSRVAESDEDDDDDDVPLSKMASPTGKKGRGAPVTTKKRGRQSDGEKAASKKGGRNTSTSRDDDGKIQNGRKDEKSAVMKKGAKGKKLTKKEIARLEAEAPANQKKTAVKGQKGKRNGNDKASRSETDESISLADMKRSKGSVQSGKNGKRKNSGGRGDSPRGRVKGKRDDSSDDEDRPPPVKKRKPAESTVWSNEDESSSSSESSSSEEEPEIAKWQVICQTEEDWQALTDSLKKSKVKCEKELYQVLAENFLPAIHALFTAKERELRRKLQDLAPKRTSSRIAVKKSKQVEEEKVKALLDHEEEERQKEEEASRREFELTVRRRKVQAEERRKLADELREKEERKKLRSLKRHERIVDRRNPSAKQKKRMLYEGLKKVLDAVKKHPDAWPFVDPVQESFAPAYYDIIQSPMDISTVEVKVQEEMYRSKAKFEVDMELIFSNCVEYNGPESEYTMMGANVASCFQEALDQHFPPGCISDGELSDIASDQDSAYCLSYPRELRRRSKALNYTEMESTSDSNDTGRDEDDDEQRSEERAEETRVYPSYHEEKRRSGDVEVQEKFTSEGLQSNSTNRDHDSVEEENSRRERNESPGDAGKKEDGGVAVPNSPKKSKIVLPTKKEEEEPSEKLYFTKEATVSEKKEKVREPSAKKKSPNRPRKTKVTSEKESVSNRKHSTTENISKRKSEKEDVSSSYVDDQTSNSHLTSLQRLEAITDRLGMSLDEDDRKDFIVRGDNSISSKSEESPEAISASPPQPVTIAKVAAKVKEDLTLSGGHGKSLNKEIEHVPVSSTRATQPLVKIKSETAPTFGPCSVSHSKPSKNTLPEVASPLVVPSNLSTVYNAVNPLDPTSTPSAKPSSDSYVSSVKVATGHHHPMVATATADTYFSNVASKSSPAGSPKVGEGDAPRLLTGFRPGKSSHFSAFHSVGKDRPRIEGSVDIKQSSFPGQLMQQSPSQIGNLSQHGAKGLSYSTFVPSGSPGFNPQQATSSKLNDPSSPFQSSKPFPSQPTIVRPVSRYPAQAAQSLRQNQYLLHQSGAISNQAPATMGPQLNILQIASAPSLTLNIQPNGLLNSQSVVNVAAGRQTVPGMYGQGMNPVVNNHHMVQHNLQQKPTLVVQYQGTPGETPPYNAQFRTNYQ